MTLLLMLACTDQEQFRVQADAATCEWKESCFGEDFDTCVEDAEQQFETTGCFFEEQEARQCVRALERMECPTSEQPEPAFPEVCTRVWTCPG